MLLLKNQISLSQCVHKTALHLTVLIYHSNIAPLFEIPF
jgi:hypothetical protein